MRYNNTDQMRVTFQKKARKFVEQQIRTPGTYISDYYLIPKYTHIKSSPINWRFPFNDELIHKFPNGNS